MRFIVVGIFGVLLAVSTPFSFLFALDAIEHAPSAWDWVWLVFTVINPFTGTYIAVSARRIYRTEVRPRPRTEVSHGG